MDFQIKKLPYLFLNVSYPITLLTTVVKSTTEMELTGISMAATKGESLLETAKLNPIIL